MSNGLNEETRNFKKLKVLGIIPARGGSKGVPGKNIMELSGKPLIAWTIQAAKKSDCLSKAFVSTDDEIIKDVALKWEAEVPFTRPSELASDTAKAIPVLQHGVQYYEGMGFNFDAVMMLQPTTPMRLFCDIDECIKIMTQDEKCTSVISVTSVEDQHPTRMKYIRNGILIDPPFCEDYENQPRQELEPMYIRNGAVYLVRTNVLMQQSSLKGKRCLPYVMPRERSVNIDSFYDIELAKWLMSRQDWWKV